MAKRITIKSAKPATDETGIDEVEPVVDEVAPAVDEEEEEVEKAQPAPAPVSAPVPVTINIPVSSVAAVPVATPDTVRVSVFKEVNPAPRIGNFSFDHDMNMPILKPGMYTVPHNVGMVLVDKQIATII